MQVPGVRYVAEPRRGLSIARNTGVRAATGELIAFTDDDAAVHPTWAARVRYGLRDPALLALTGLVLPAELATQSQLVFEHDLGGFGHGYRMLDFDAEFFRTLRWKGVPVWLVGAGANMAFRRRAFERVGGFDERLGAGAAGCSEDSELWYRLLAAGERCRYDPALVVYHYHRADEAALRAQVRAYMRGHVDALLIQYERHRHAGNLLRLCVILPRFYASLLLSACLHGFTVRTRLVRSELAGCLAGIAYYRGRRASEAAPRPVVGP
jgi:GT2 family glycosyltransferase